MSRAMNVKLTPAQVTKKCKQAGVSISAMEALPSGDTHVVLNTADDAEKMRGLFGKSVVQGAQKRTPRSVPVSRHHG